MKNQTLSVAIKYGLMYALCSIVLRLIMEYSLTTEQMVSYGKWASLSETILLIVFLYMAMKELKALKGGYLSYGNGVGLGALLGLTGGILVAIFVLVYFSKISPGSLTKIKEIQSLEMDKQLDKMGDQATPEVEAQMRSIAEKSTSPQALFIFSLLGSVIIETIIALIMAIFMKNTPPEDYNEQLKVNS